MMDASPEVRWLEDRLSNAGYVVFILLASFDGWGATRPYTFAYLFKLRGGRTLAEAEGKREVGANCEEV